MKKTLVLILLTFLVSGCVFGGNGLKQLNVTWREVALENTLSTAGEGIGMEDKYYGTTSGGSTTAIEIEADVSGDTSGEFDFTVLSENPHKKIANNVLRIEPQVAEKGTVAVSSQGLEKVVDYEIFSAGKLSGSMNIVTPVGFDFKTGTRAEGQKYDMYTRAIDEVIVAKIGAVIDKTPGTFWDEFTEVNNLHEYEYEEMSFKPDFGKVYLVECAVGYAAMMIDTAYHGSWGFVYKYSETGIFD